MKPSVKNVKNLLTKKSSDLLLTGGVACILGGGLLAIRQTPKAVQLLDRNEKETTIEKIKIVAPLYVPSILLVGVGIAQIVCSRNISNNKIAAMATAYTVSETAFKTYREKVRDIVEPDKYEEIKREVATERLKKDPLGNKEVIIQTTGDILIYDTMSGRYFKGSINDIDKAVNILNKRMRSDMTINLNDLYNEIGLPIVKIGADMGWSIDYDDIDIRFDSGITEDGQPCLVLDYDVRPLI